MINRVSVTKSDPILKRGPFAYHIFLKKAEKKSQSVVADSVKV